VRHPPGAWAFPADPRRIDRRGTGQHPGPAAGQDGGAESGGLDVIRHADRAAEYVGENLRPERAPAAPPVRITVGQALRPSISPIRPAVRRVE
jgi:hypothetical protein